jgi:hypothetical protein
LGLFDLGRWPGSLVFALAGVTAVVFAFVTVNLFTHAMANLDFIQRHGLVAIREGALVQLGLLTLWGVLALISFLVFKACEVELLYRYHDWTSRRRAAPEDRNPDGEGASDRAKRRRLFRLRRR